MLHPVDDAFAPKDDKHGAQNRPDVARPCPSGAHARRQGRVVAARELNQVTEGDDREHEPELKALDNVGAGDLEKVLLLKLLEDS